MSRQTTVCCDRCGSPCRDFSIVELAAGPIRASVGRSIDLCPDCTERFKDWIRSGRQASQDGIGEALADTAVSSMALAGALV